MPLHKLKVAVLVGQLVFGALDARVSRQNVVNGGREYNPLARPFVHSRAVYGGNAALSLGTWWLARKIEKKHPKLAWALRVNDLSGHASGWLFTRREMVHK